MRQELIDAGRSASTLNQWRTVVRGVWGVGVHSPAMAWEWKAGPRDAVPDDLHFYTPAQVLKLRALATDRDDAIFALLTQAGPRLSEVRALRVCDVDARAMKVRFARGYTDAGGLSANQRGAANGGEAGQRVALPR